MLDHTELPRYLAKIDRTFGVNRLLELGVDNDSIVRYYTESERAYRLFHSRDGSIHMTLATSSSRSPDSLGQARIVDRHVKDLSASAILELGCGKGFNVAYLARNHPQAQLVGIDLTPSHLSLASRKYAKLQNLRFHLGDFHSLPFRDEEFDLIFEVEAVCHAHDPERVFREAYRVMRPGGRFVLFDGFRAPDLSKYAKDLQVAVRLVELSMAVQQFPPVEHWLALATAAGFDVLDTQDLSDAILPNLERFQFLARGFYKYPTLNRQLLRLLPKSLLTNSVAGLLLPFTVSAGAQRYYSIVLEKRVSNLS
jgi:ubiquinone/menaquinone biosynthesis C-methylase UbiE